jgi:hypothetical protein
MINISLDRATGKAKYAATSTALPTRGIDLAASVLVPKVPKVRGKRRCVHTMDFADWNKEHETVVAEASSHIVDAIYGISMPNHIITIKNQEKFDSDMAMHMYNTFVE